MNRRFGSFCSKTYSCFLVFAQEEESNSYRGSLASSVRNQGGEPEYCEMAVRGLERSGEETPLFIPGS